MNPYIAFTLGWGCCTLAFTLAAIIRPGIFCGKDGSA